MIEFRQDLEKYNQGMKERYDQFKRDMQTLNSERDDQLNILLKEYEVMKKAMESQLERLKDRNLLIEKRVRTFHTEFSGYRNL